MAFPVVHLVRRTAAGRLACLVPLVTGHAEFLQAIRKKQVQRRKGLQGKGGRRGEEEKRLAWWPGTPYSPDGELGNGYEPVVRSNENGPPWLRIKRGGGSIPRKYRRPGCFPASSFVYAGSWYVSEGCRWKRCVLAFSAGDVYVSGQFVAVTLVVLAYHRILAVGTWVKDMVVILTRDTPRLLTPT